MPLRPGGHRGPPREPDRRLYDHAPWAPWSDHEGCAPMRGSSDDQVRRLLDQVAAGLPSRDRRLYEMVVLLRASTAGTSPRPLRDFAPAGLMLRDLRLTVTGDSASSSWPWSAGVPLPVDGWDGFSALTRSVRLAVDRHMRGVRGVREDDRGGGAAPTSSRWCRCCRGCGRRCWPGSLRPTRGLGLAWQRAGAGGSGGGRAGAVGGLGVRPCPRRWLDGACTSPRAEFKGPGGAAAPARRARHRVRRRAPASTAVRPVPPPRSAR